MRPVLFLALVAACDSPGATTIDPDAPAVATDAAPDAEACGLRAGARGKSMRTIKAGGLDRQYIVYLPPGSSTDRMPLVFVHHGYTMSGQLMFDITRYAQLADTEHVALAFPDGQAGPNSLGAPWNVGANVCPSTAGAPPIAMGDDFAMLDAIEADISADQCLDREHVYVTGFSMGGYFSHHAGCMRPDVRAVAPHSGGTHELSGCVNAVRPIIIFHGRADGLIPPGCNDPDSTPISGVTPAAIAWAQHNGCAATTTTRVVQGGHCVRWDGCPPGGQVELCTFDGMGHCWAGGAPNTGIYSCPNAASATQLEWEFFKTYAW